MSEDSLTKSVIQIIASFGAIAVAVIAGLFNRRADVQKNNPQGSAQAEAKPKTRHGLRILWALALVLAIASLVFGIIAYNSQQVQTAILNRANDTEQVLKTGNHDLA